MFEVLCALLGGIMLVQKKYKNDNMVRDAGHPLLVGCETPEEIITVKCEYCNCHGQPMPKLTSYELALIEGWILDGRNIRKSIKEVYFKQTGRQAGSESATGNSEWQLTKKSNEALMLENNFDESCDEDDLYYMSQQRKDSSIYIDAKDVDLSFKKCVKLGFEIGDQRNYNYWYKDCLYYKTDKNRMTPNEYFEIRNKR